jgi:hypothetical protein
MMHAFLPGRIRQEAQGKWKAATYLVRLTD